MWIFNLFKKKEEKDVSTLNNSELSLVERKLSPQDTNALSTQNALVFHPDLEGLIWVADGPLKNYSPDKETYLNFDLGYGVKMSISMAFSTEPSAISLRLPIQTPNKMVEVPKMSYYPSYSGMTDMQRWTYLNFLRNPYEAVDIGYVFVLYYGLERHLLAGDFEKAFDVILKLRNVHKNNSFLGYSSTALILSCVEHKRPDYLNKYLSSINDSTIQSMNVSLFLLCLHIFDLELTPRHIMLFSKKFAFENNRYIKGYPEFFVSELEEALLEKTKMNTINLQKVVKNMRNVRNYTFTPFANISLHGEANEVTIPDLTTNIKLTSLCNSALNAAHERTKKRIKNLPKEEKVTPQKAASAKKEIIMDDSLISRDLKDEEKAPTRVETNASNTGFSFGSKKVGGLIGYLGLSKFWQSLTDDERTAITGYTSRRFERTSASLTEGVIDWTSATPYSFLSSYAHWAITYKKYDLAEKMLVLAEEYNPPAIELHFIYNHSIELYYKQRDSDSDFLEKAKEFCIKDIALFPKYEKELNEGTASMSSCPSFKQLAIIYEKEGNFEEGIKICKLAIKYKLSDGTKGNFEGRLLKLQNKLAASRH